MRILKAKTLTAVPCSKLPPQRPRDQVALDLTSSLANDIDKRIAVNASDRTVSHDTCATMNANCILAHPNGRLARYELHFGGSCKVDRALIDAPCPVVDTASSLSIGMCWRTKRPGPSRKADCRCSARNSRNDGTLPYRMAGFWVTPRSASRSVGSEPGGTSRASCASLRT
jgi:hypothetical protein